VTSELNEWRVKPRRIRAPGYPGSTGDRIHGYKRQYFERLWRNHNIDAAIAAGEVIDDDEAPGGVPPAGPTPSPPSDRPTPPPGAPPGGHPEVSPGPASPVVPGQRGEPVSRDVTHAESGEEFFSEKGESMGPISESTPLSRDKTGHAPSSPEKCAKNTEPESFLRDVPAAARKPRQLLTVLRSVDDYGNPTWFDGVRPSPVMEERLAEHLADLREELAAAKKPSGYGSQPPPDDLEIPSFLRRQKPGGES
jgi:hypothetical protein